LIKKFAHPDIVQILIILLKTIILYCWEYIDGPSLEVLIKSQSKSSFPFEESSFLMFFLKLHQHLMNVSRWI
jgi:hypothetical protein